MPGEHIEEPPWPLPDIIRKLCEGIDILLNDLSYDGHGYELLVTARAQAQLQLDAHDTEVQKAKELEELYKCPECGGKAHHTLVASFCLECKWESHMCGGNSE